MPEKPVGKVEHYYPKVQAAAVRLTQKVKLGDRVHIVGHGDDFEEKVTSMQLDHRPIEEGQPGQSIGLWVKERVHEGDDVLLVEDEPMPRAAKPRMAKPKARKAAKPAKRPARKAKAPARRAAAARKPKAARRARPSRKAAKAARRRR